MWLQAEIGLEIASRRSDPGPPIIVENNQPTGPYDHQKLADELDIPITVYHCHPAELDQNTYPAGIKVSDAEIKAVNLHRHDFHGEWNYTVSPKRRALER